nr:transposase [Altericroceibacterium indicum]
MPQIATPVFGYKSHISIDRRYGVIRKAAVTSAADSDGRQLRRMIDTSNTASDVWADSAYRSSKNEALLKSNMLKSRIHRRKPTSPIKCPRSTHQTQNRSSRCKSRGFCGCPSGWEQSWRFCAGE